MCCYWYSDIPVESLIWPEGLPQRHEDTKFLLSPFAVLRVFVPSWFNPSIQQEWRRV